jgi:hypothetical protein
MASNLTIENIRDKAKDYADSSFDYTGWTRNVKNLVREADEDNWGTYIVACALLEEAIPSVDKNQKIRNVDYKEKLSEFIGQLAKVTRTNSVTCAVLSGIIASIIAVMLYGGLFQGYITRVAAVVINPAISDYGAILFAISGGAFSGYAFGARTDCLNIDGTTSHIVSCLTGILSPFLCVMFPPVVLLSAWCAWHASVKPAAKLVSFSRQSSFRAVGKRRNMRAKDSRAPLFVKDALRLANKYCSKDDEIGEMSRKVLSANQCDYGSFAVWCKILTRYQTNERINNVLNRRNVRASELFENVSRETDVGGAQGTVGFSWLSNTISGLRNSARRMVIIRSVCSSLVTALILLGTSSFGTYSAKNSLAVIANNSRIFLFLVVIACVIVALKLAVKVNATIDFDEHGKRKASIAWPAWYTAWLIMIGIFLIYILSMI